MSAQQNYEIGDLVGFKTLRGGIVFAKVVERKRYVPLMGERIKIRITSRKNRFYPLGLVYETTPGSLFLRKAKVA